MGLTGPMSDDAENTTVSATREVAAPAATVFELIADPARQPSWDGNDNLAAVVGGTRVRGVGDVFAMRLTNDQVRDNHVVAFEEGRSIAWRPADEGAAPAGHEWRWDVEPVDASSCRVTHTYDWTDLTDERRIPKARATGEAQLRASLDRLAEQAEQSGQQDGQSGRA